MPDQPRFLLGYGERLTTPLEAVGRGGPKRAPYTFEQARDRLASRAARTAADLDALPGAACPGDEAQAVTYRLEVDEQLVVVEPVPAQVCQPCGDRVYAADVVERLQQTIWHRRQPSRLLRTLVYDVVAA